MEREADTGEEMNIPESIFRDTLRNAIKSGEDGPIDNLAAILYSSIVKAASHETTLGRHALQFEHQHKEIEMSIESVREGFAQVQKQFEQVDKRFEQVDKRFEQVDKRFEQVDKRFEDMNKRFTFQSWLIGIGFVTINTLIVIMKVIE